MNRRAFSSNIPLSLKQANEKRASEQLPSGLAHFDGGKTTGALLHFEGYAVIFVQLVAVHVVDVNEDAFA